MKLPTEGRKRVRSTNRIPLRKARFDVGEKVITNQTAPQPTARELRRREESTPLRQAAKERRRVPSTRTTPVLFWAFHP